MGGECLNASCCNVKSSHWACSGEGCVRAPEGVPREIHGGTPGPRQPHAGGRRAGAAAAAGRHEGRAHPQPPPQLPHLLQVRLPPFFYQDSGACFFLSSQSIPEALLVDMACVATLLLR